LRSASVSLVVAPAATAQERAAALRAAGNTALRGNRPTQAVQALQRARAEDPTDHLSMVALGDAYVRLNQYKEAIVEFENALRVMPRHRSGVPMRLAMAYVAVGDDVNAARVLREDGVPEQRIPSDLDRLRATLRARK
jgi:predicted Zn-dependent protease